MTVSCSTNMSGLNLSGASAVAGRQAVAGPGTVIGQAGGPLLFDGSMYQEITGKIFGIRHRACDSWAEALQQLTNVRRRHSLMILSERSIALSGFTFGDGRGVIG